jgi:hypothetical protein
VRVLLDECVDRRLAGDIHGHDVKTVPDLGWAALKNGELLARAEHEFEALVTVDRSLPFQQDLSRFSIAVIVLRAPSKVYSAVEPTFFRIYRVEQGADVVKSVPTNIDRVQNFKLTIGIQELRKIFDGSEKVVAVTMIPWYVRRSRYPRLGSRRRRGGPDRVAHDARSDSYARPGKLFTASRDLMVAARGRRTSRLSGPRARDACPRLLSVDVRLSTNE